MYGYDGGKKVKGRKRHIIVDTQGLLMGVIVTEANAQERWCAVGVLMEKYCDSSNLNILWVDSGYSGKRFSDGVKVVCGSSVNVVKRNQKGFQVLPRRWVVERTFGWLGRYRRLSKDYEKLPEVSESIIYICMIRLMLKRFAA